MTVVHIPNEPRPRDEPQNVGSGVGLFKRRLGKFLQFKSLKSKSKQIAISATDDEVEIDLLPDPTLEEKIKNTPVGGDASGTVGNIKIEKSTTVVRGGGGTRDHGALKGLEDDDHPQYLNVPRANSLYAPITTPTNSDFTYVGGVLTKIEFDSGRVVNLNYSDGILASIEDVGVRTGTFTYDGDGNLTNLEWAEA